MGKEITTQKALSNLDANLDNAIQVNAYFNFKVLFLFQVQESIFSIV